MQIGLKINFKCELFKKVIYLFAQTFGKMLIYLK